MVLTRWLMGGGLLLLGGLISGGLSSCSASSPSAAAEIDQVNVRLVHVSPNTKGVGLMAGDSTVLETHSYGQISTYVALPAGEYDLNLFSPNWALSDEFQFGRSILTDTLADLEADGVFSVVAIDEVSRLTAIVLNDDVQPLFGQALVRFVHAVPDAPALEWQVDQEVVVGELVFGEASDYQAVDPGFLTLNLRETLPASPEEAAETPTLQPMRTDSPLKSIDLELAAGKVYTIYTTGLLRGSPSLDVVVGEDLLAGRSL
ncbi:MAG: DUF4397 domain-containing protein [Cyanobacteriota bacterium]|nr:DUF4397 domain-containing protein [Cyanobacteriota bacterium]